MEGVTYSHTRHMCSTKSPRFVTSSGRAAGAAALMAVGFGLLPDIKDIKSMIRVHAVYQSNPQSVQVYDRIFPVFKGLYKNNKQAYAALNGDGGKR